MVSGEWVHLEVPLTTHDSLRPPSPITTVDANILLYAHDATATLHSEARSWWDGQLSGTEPVGLSWLALNAFIRVGTNPRVYDRPMSLEEATTHVQSWLDQPCVSILLPTEDHWKIFRDLLQKGNATANLVSDAHLAAIAVEHNAVLQTTDGDYSIFPGLKFRNPIKPRR